MSTLWLNVFLTCHFSFLLSLIWKWRLESWKVWCGLIYFENDEYFCWEIKPGVQLHGSWELTHFWGYPLISSRVTGWDALLVPTSVPQSEMRFPFFGGKKDMENFPPSLSFVNHHARFFLLLQSRRQYVWRTVSKGHSRNSACLASTISIILSFNQFRPLLCTLHF